MPTEVQAAQGRDMYGAEGNVEHEKIDLCETASEAGAISDANAKRRALAKLNADDKKVLGISDD